MMMNTEFKALVTSFPSLWHLHMCNHEAVMAHLRNRAEEGGNSGGKQAAKFCLHVWNGSEFSIAEAFGKWDESHKKAFLAWAANPRFF